MSVGCLRWVLGHAFRGCAGSLNPSRPSSLRLCGSARCAPALYWRSVQLAPLTTTVDETGEEVPPKKKKPDPKARASISSIGRKIHQRHLQVISETGENLGTMHRADVVRIMDERGLKLVPLNEKKDPPVYRLMSGKQIHEEQLRLREKQKAKGAPAEVKEVLFSSDIASHDLLTKLNHVRSWLGKKNHVRVTLRSGRVEQTQPLDVALENMVQQMDITVGFVSRPKVIRDGKSAICILRPPSAKELLEERKKSKQTGAQPSVPEAQPSVPEAQPSVPEAQPSVPEAQPNVPEAQPSDPGAQPSDPEAQPSVPEAQPNVPEAQPSDPGAQPSVPEAQPQKPKVTSLDRSTDS